MSYLPAGVTPAGVPLGFAGLPTSPATSQPAASPGRRLARRCYELRLVVPPTYEALEAAVEVWIASCVMSRTLINGRPVRRERGLVRGNPTLRQVWEQIQDAVDQPLVIRAEYVWGPDRVDGIRFSVPASVYRFAPETITACRFPIADAPRIETAAARRTLQTSAGVASSFERSVGALDARGRFTKTILNDKFWFAKLYELITYFEIRDRNRFRHVPFVMHFIPIFYDMYHQALSDWQVGRRSAVHALWRHHFSTSERPSHNGLQSWISGITNSVVTGVRAHIQGDMAAALEQAYRSYTTKYCLTSLRFDDLKGDFFETNHRIFETVTASFFLEMSRRSPLPLSPEMGQFVIGTGARYGAGGLDIDEVYRWREAAWQEAKRRLGQL